MLSIRRAGLNPTKRVFLCRMSSSIAVVSTKKSYARQIPADVEGKLIEGSMKAKAHQVCHNIDEILKAAGSSAEKAVKVVVYTTDFDLMPEFDAVYNKYFPQKPPRTSLQVQKLPLGVSVEVDVIAST